MLKRIAAIDAAAKDVAALKKAAGKAEGLVVATLTAGEPVPAGISAVLAGAEAGKTGIELALRAAREHAALLGLLAEAIDAREGHKSGSCARLHDHVARFTVALGLSEDERASAERGALLHDIGKVRVSNDTLLKKSVLTYDEWIDLQGHTTKGADLLEALGFEAAVVEIARSHHECFDGDGYPQHLERDAIPLLARILKICDVFTAMTSPRHYRSTVTSIEDGIEHLKSERGKHFDPELVDAFIEHKIGTPWA